MPPVEISRILPVNNGKFGKTHRLSTSDPTTGSLGIVLTITTNKSFVLLFELAFTFDVNLQNYIFMYTASTKVINKNCVVTFTP